MSLIRPRKKTQIEMKAQTLLEVIIASVIIAMVMAGLGASFVLGKRYVLHSHSRITAAELGRYYLEKMPMKVRQDEWTNCTKLCEVTSGDDSKTLDRVTYTASCEPADVERLCKATITLKWYEITPQ